MAVTVGLTYDDSSYQRASGVARSVHPGVWFALGGAPGCDVGVEAMEALRSEELAQEKGG
ncbi:MAG TPA: hypothetical protein VHB18_03755 [Mycobacteriales bacterium]|jgi:hypothetical protein|nr:hypothetical protein [Mycobacteriales bacterium]